MEAWKSTYSLGGLGWQRDSSPTSRSSFAACISRAMGLNEFDRGSPSADSRYCCHYLNHYLTTLYIPPPRVRSLRPRFGSQSHQHQIPSPCSRTASSKSAELVLPGREFVVVWSWWKVTSRNFVLISPIFENSHFIDVEFVLYEPGQKSGEFRKWVVFR